MSGPLVKAIIVLWIGIVILAELAMFYSGIELWLVGFFFGGAVLMTGLLGAIMWYWNKMVRQGFERMRQAGNYLAHWTYTPEEWDNFTYNEGKKAPNVALKIGLFLLIPMLLVLVILAGSQGSSSKSSSMVVPMAIFGLGTVVLVTAARFVYELDLYKQRSRRVGEVYITEGAVYQDNALSLLGDVGIVRLEEGNPSVLCISGTVTLSRSYRGESAAYDLRIPVPGGHEDEARQLMEHFSPSARLT